MQLKLVFVYFLHPSQTLRQNWDQRKTLKQNLQSLGLAFDANAAVPISKRKVKVSSLLHSQALNVFLFYYIQKRKKIIMAAYLQDFSK